nr:immunoglobulin heavy chain junction region [Mus musculus]
CTYFDYW